ncbi:50S ribosomal protein L11 methyltransferase [Lentisalinibacter orientalis]|uniref:50S ribosomal protein L11 methyltransferase n=1 Tax=Lentisalinibacter orientalis TaxID=2992241 RepID=UPI00386A5A2E
MSWRQFTMALEGLDAARVEEALEDLGAGAVTYSDAGDSPVLEPAPGETPLWPATLVTALFDDTLDEDALSAGLRAALELDELPAWRVETLADRAWEREWLRDFHPMRFGQRLWVCPTGSVVEDPDAVVLDMDPGLAFGTGTHATTALCLEWLDAARIAGRRVLDYGCGSGILAIAALLLGAGEATATDIDPQALTATRANAARNDVAGRLGVAAPDELGDTAFDVVLANILAAPLAALAPRLAGLTRGGGEIVLSGILASQADEIRAAYEPWFEIAPAVAREDWIMISGRRRED